jgi:2-amino-4-hydroxy-6-hydroxymethyldihydropteridine diphosphokinase
MVNQGGIFIGLGSNLGDRSRHLREALAELSASDDIRVLRVSSFHNTEPQGGPADQPLYLNAVAELATDLSPRQLLEHLQGIERRHGRERTVPNGPRTLDLDLLIHGRQVVDEPDLVVPHPRMWQRDFVMQPLAEICDLGRLVAARRLRTANRPKPVPHVPRHPDGAKVLA